jgi:centractin
VVIGTKVGRAKHMRIMPGGALETEQNLSGPSSIFVGKKLDEHRGSFILEYPMDKGAVVDGGWDAMESLWEVS